MSGVDEGGAGLEAEVAGVRVDEEGVDAREDARAAGDVGREGGAVEGVEVGVGDEGMGIGTQKCSGVWDIGRDGVEEKEGVGN